MTLTSKSCVEATCDGCGDGWDDEEYGTPHFPADSNVVGELVKTYEWSSEDGHVFCRHCARERVCEKEGHEPDEPIPAMTINGRDYPEVIYCGRCSQRLSADQEGKQQ